MAGPVQFRGRSLRERLRVRHSHDDEDVPLLLNRPLKENVKDILTNVSRRQGISNSKKLGNLNNFVKLCCKFQTDADFGYSLHDILCCLRLGLLHAAKEVRAGCLRALRYVLRDPATLDVMIELHIDKLVARSLDICVSNHIERIHAMRLLRKMILVCPKKLPASLLNVLLSIGNDGVEERDQLFRVSMACLSELAFYCPERVAERGGLSTLLHSVLDCHEYPRINESLLASILYMLNHPRTRVLIKPNIDLEQLLAPFTDDHFRHHPGNSEQTQQGDDEDYHYAACKMALVTVLRSWPGMIRLCRSDGTGIHSLIGVLYLKKDIQRQNVMDVLYEVFWLTIPKWTDNFSEALLSADISEMQMSWKLFEGFVAEEGRAILPHISKIRSNLVDNHMALLLLAFIHAGLLEALVQVIVTGDDHLCVRATILLGELLHLSNRLLPSECRQTSQCLPSLIAAATTPDRTAVERERAYKAVTFLDRLHTLKKRGPVPCSLYLEQILRIAQGDKVEAKRPLKLTKDKLMPYLSKDNEESVSQAIRESNVLLTKENLKWNWELIGAILKWSDDSLKKMDDQNNLRFIRRLAFFFKPSNRLFSALELNRETAQTFSYVGLLLIDFLLERDDSECNSILDDLLSDLSTCLMEVRQQRAPLDATFSVSKIMNTLAQDYFLFIGKFSSTQKGTKLLEKAGLLQILLDLVTITSHDCYVKLIVSSLDYTQSGLTRIILSKALTATSETARLYTAGFFRVLLRARVPYFCTWAMELLVTQLYDQCRPVAMKALAVIDEACEEEANLLSLIQMRPSFLHLGDKGTMLVARFFSVPTGFKFLTDANYVSHELEKWHKTFNLKYVKIVEEMLYEALTTYEKSYDGSYRRRTSNKRPRKAVYLPSHLYGQLVQHKDGFNLLNSQSYLHEYFTCVRAHPLHTEEDLLMVKAALWAVGHIGSSFWGISLLREERVVPEIIKLAEESAVFSIRGTAFYSLGLIASTPQGARLLKEYGWESVLTNHHELWPVMHEDEFVTEDFTEETQSYASCASLESEPNVLAQGSPARTACFVMGDGGEARSRSGSDCSQRRTVRSLKSRENSIPEGKEVRVYSTSEVDDQVGVTEAQEEVVAVDMTHVAIGQQVDKSEEYRTRIDSGIQNEEGNTGDRLAVKSARERLVRIRSISQQEMPSSPSEFLSLKQRSSSVKNERSSSYDSYSKSRSDSFNTDSNTSGFISSNDSACRTHAEPGLTPIPSQISLTHQTSDAAVRTVHPSVLMRKLANLQRTPSIRKRHSNPVMSSVDVSIPYTSVRDAHGLAVLKTLKRQRTTSVDKESDILTPETSSIGEPDISSLKTHSLDYRAGVIRNSSFASVMELDSGAPSSRPSPIHYRKDILANTKYIGLCLPVDIELIFQVQEGEDTRCYLPCEQKSRNDTDLSTYSDLMRSRSSSEEESVFEFHTPISCMGCYKATTKDLSTSVKECEDNGNFVNLDALSHDLPVVKEEGVSSRRPSDSQPPMVSSSLSDTGTGTKGMLEWNTASQMLVRKEVLRFVVNLSSSVGAKSSEQGLLALKQKFPKAFQDICLYSEICHLLSNYSFRLKARRFIQELFQDLTFDELFDEPRRLLQFTEYPTIPDEKLKCLSAPPDNFN